MLALSEKNTVLSGVRPKVVGSSPMVISFSSNFSFARAICQKKGKVLEKSSIQHFSSFLFPAILLFHFTKNECFDDLLVIFRIDINDAYRIRCIALLRDQILTGIFDQVNQRFGLDLSGRH